jgi:hypothetical protein
LRISDSADPLTPDRPSRSNLPEGASRPNDASRHASRRGPNHPASRRPNPTRHGRPGNRSRNSRADKLGSRSRTARSTDSCNTALEPVPSPRRASAFRPRQTRWYHGAPKPAGLFRLCCRRSDKFIRSHFVLHQDCSGPSHRRRHLKRNPLTPKWCAPGRTNVMRFTYDAVFIGFVSEARSAAQAEGTSVRKFGRPCQWLATRLSSTPSRETRTGSRTLMTI